VAAYNLLAMTALGKIKNQLTSRTCLCYYRIRVKMAKEKTITSIWAGKSYGQELLSTKGVSFEGAWNHQFGLTLERREYFFGHQC